MIKGIFKALASLLLISAASLFIAGFAAVGFASFLLTFPFVWGRPTRRRVKAGIGLVTAFMAFMSTMQSPDDLRDALKMARNVASALPPDD